VYGYGAARRTLLGRDVLVVLPLLCLCRWREEGLGESCRFDKSRGQWNMMYRPGLLVLYYYDRMFSDVYIGL
jgi:hypothetical protein